MRPGVLLSLVYCGAAFGGSFLFMRLAAPEVPAIGVAFGRVAIAALALLPFARRDGLAAIRVHWRHYAFVGLFMVAVPFTLFAYAERSITAGLGAIINATSPLWLAIIMAVWLRHAPTARRVAAIAIGFVGVGVIVGLEGIAMSPEATAGVAAAVVASASYGIALTYIRRRVAPQPPLHLAFGQLVLGSVMLLPLAVLSAPDVEVTGEAVIALLGIGLLSTAIAWPLLFRLNRDVGPLATSTVTFLNPVFGTIWGVLFLAEAVSAGFLAGAALVFVALALIFDLRLPARATARGGTPSGAAAERQSP